MKRIKTILISAAAILVGALPGRDALAVEEAEYTVDEQRDGWEIRSYKPRIEARVTVETSYENASNEGFRILANYIFGGNQPKAKIEMTAPVSVQKSGQKIDMTAPVAVSDQGEGRWEIAFVMPKSWSMESLPAPNDPRIRLTPLPAERMAALRFSGLARASDVESNEQRLLNALQKAGLASVGPPTLARYNPPWTPGPFRRNEILIAIGN